MATLTVTATGNTDFRGGPAETNIDQIRFQTPGPGTAVAIFEPAQFGAGLISNFVHIVGDGFSNQITVDFNNSATTFSAAGWTFENWGSNDAVFIIASNGNDNITGSSRKDVILCRSGLDHVDAGTGNDVIQFSAAPVSGTTVEGGNQDAGGVDELVLLTLGAIDLRPVAISGVEQLTLPVSGLTAIVSGSQIGAGGFSIVEADSSDTVALTVHGNLVDLSGVTFANWGTDDTITITAEGALPTLIGSNQKDIINGAGNSLDTMTGGQGADTLNGGNNNDKFRYTANDHAQPGETVNGGAGTDEIVLANVSNIGFVGVTINSVETLDYTTGNSTATLDDDQIGGGEIVTVSGSTGIDKLIVTTDDQLASLAGVTFTGWTNGADTISILGTALQDLITGSSQNDIIDGKGGADLMGGGAGDDTYIVDVSNDAIVESAGNGTDTAQSSVSYTLSAGQQIENLTLTGAGNINGTGNGFANVILGTTGANTLAGSGGADTLDGRSGGDTMAGGLGDDTFMVRAGGDKVAELAGEGNDSVFAAVTYKLAPGVHVEKLSTTGNTGTAAINLAGNELAQTITGNDGINTLDSGTGAADTLSGRSGNDTYLVRNAGDTIVEGAGQGTDSAFAAVSYVLSTNAQVENLSTISNVGTGAINLTGNAFAQTIFGNDGVNTLDSRAGAADTLSGRGGNDSYLVRNAGDTVVEGAGQGTDTVFAAVSYVLGAAAQVENLSTISNVGTGAINLTGNAFAQVITGNDGVNTLDSREGAADTLSGRGGNDSYLVRNAGDTVVEGAGQGTDTVFAAVSYVLGAAAQVENLLTTGNTGTGAINLTGNAFAQTIFGNDGANVLNGGAGNDTINGRGGADTFVFDTALNAATNVDTIVGYATADDVIRLENAVFTGLPTGDLAAIAFFAGPGATAAADALDRIVYNTTTGALFFDADGVGGAAAVQFATLQGAPAITNAEFVVV